MWRVCRLILIGENQNTERKACPSATLSTRTQMSLVTDNDCTILYACVHLIVLSLLFVCCMYIFFRDIFSLFSPSGI
jgi:hypothetical protein